MRILSLLPCVIALAAVLPAKAAPISDRALHIAQLTTFPAATGGAEPASPAEQRMLRRFPQPVRVGNLIGLPVIDENHHTIGYVWKVVRTARNKAICAKPDLVSMLPRPMERLMPLAQRIPPTIMPSTMGSAVPVPASSPSPPSLNMASFR